MNAHPLGRHEPNIQPRAGAVADRHQRDVEDKYNHSRHLGRGGPASPGCFISQPPCAGVVARLSKKLQNDVEGHVQFVRDNSAWDFFSRGLPWHATASGFADSVSILAKRFPPSIYRMDCSGRSP